MQTHFKFRTDIEQLNPVPLCRASWCYAALPASLKTHPIIGPTLRIGSRICLNPKFSSIQSPLFPILGNPSFLPGIVPGAFDSFLEKSCSQASHFLTSETWPTVTLIQPGGAGVAVKPFFQIFRTTDELSKSTNDS